MQQRRPIDSQAVSLMLFLSALWGMQQVVLKMAGEDMTPLMQIVFRSAIAAVLVGAIIYFKKQKFQLAHTWKAGLVAGIFFSLEYSFVAESLTYTSASHVTVLLYSAPIFVALALHFFDPQERLNPIQWLGLALLSSELAALFYCAREQLTLYPSKFYGGILSLCSQVLAGPVSLSVFAALSWQKYPRLRLSFIKY